MSAPHPLALDPLAIVVLVGVAVPVPVLEWVVALAVGVRALQRKGAQ